STTTQGGFGGREDDRPRSLFLHVRQNGPGEHEGGGEVDPKEPFPALVGHIRGGSHVVHDSGVIDQDVNSAESLRRGIDDARHGLGGTEITDDGLCLCPGASNLLHRLLSSLCVDVGDEHGRAFCGEHPSRGWAAAPATACVHLFLALKTHVHCPFPPASALRTTSFPAVYNF